MQIFIDLLHAKAYLTAETGMTRIFKGGTSAERILHEMFLLSYEFLTTKCSESFPKFLNLFFVGPKNPANSRGISRQISLRKIKKNVPTSFCSSAGGRILPNFG